MHTKVERDVYKAIWNTIDEHHGMYGGDYEIDDIAPFVYIAIQPYLNQDEAEPLEVLFRKYNITDVQCSWVLFESCDEYDNCEDLSHWRAFLSRDNIISAERTWYGEGSTHDAAIRDAIQRGLST